MVDPAKVKSAVEKLRTCIGKVKGPLAAHGSASLPRIAPSFSGSVSSRRYN